jgi:hypothetical protein
MQSKRHAREIAASPANRQNSTPFRVFDLDVFVYTSRPSDTALRGLGFRLKVRNSRAKKDATPYAGASMCKKKDEKIAMPVSI